MSAFGDTKLQTISERAMLTESERSQVRHRMRRLMESYRRHPGMDDLALASELIIHIFDKPVDG